MDPHLEQQGIFPCHVCNHLVFSQSDIIRHCRDVHKLVIDYPHNGGQSSAAGASSGHGSVGGQHQPMVHGGIGMLSHIHVPVKKDLHGSSSGGGLVKREAELEDEDERHQTTEEDVDDAEARTRASMASVATMMMMRAKNEIAVNQLCSPGAACGAASLLLPGAESLKIPQQMQQQPVPNPQPQKRRSTAKQKGYGSPCSVFGCKNRGSTPGVSLHEFPKDKMLRKLWIMHAGRGEDWTPCKSSVICSRHFDPKLFGTTNRRKRLKPNAIPTLFGHLFRADTALSEEEANLIQRIIRPVPQADN